MAKRSGDDEDYWYYPKNPIGKCKMHSFLKQCAERMGFENWETFSGRAIRRWGISKLCNDSGVSFSESMAAARHDSIGQHWKYITQDNASEVNRLKAMGFAQD